MADELAAVSALLVFISILVAWNFISELVNGFNSQFGQLFYTPDHTGVLLSAIVFVGAIVAARVVYSNFTQE